MFKALDVRAWLVLIAGAAVLAGAALLGGHHQPTPTASHGTRFDNPLARVPEQAPPAPARLGSSFGVAIPGSHRLRFRIPNGWQAQVAGAASAVTIDAHAPGCKATYALDVQSLPTVSVHYANAQVTVKPAGQAAVSTASFGRYQVVVAAGGHHRMRDALWLGFKQADQAPRTYVLMGEHTSPWLELRLHPVAASCGAGRLGRRLAYAIYASAAVIK